MIENVDIMNIMSVSKVEEYFDGLLRGKLSDNIFFTKMPTSIQKGWKSFVVVDCGSSIRDFDAYGQGSVLVTMFVTPNAGGKKNAKEMYRMESKLNEIISTSSDEHYVISKENSYARYDAASDCFYNIVKLNIIIR